MFIVALIIHANRGILLLNSHFRNPNPPICGSNILSLIVDIVQIVDKQTKLSSIKQQRQSAG